jgi:cyclopropane fatty-acyl-phospholipid synthase-like methyltransferase
MSKEPFDLAPGNVLQNMYLKQRLKSLPNKQMKFIELGAGNGNISSILLNHGLTGIGYDLSESACNINRSKNAIYIQNGKYEVKNSDFFSSINSDKVDIIISSHVIEHLPPEIVDAFFEKSKSLLNTDGKIITLVPSSMRHWGIEDETAGHYRRFEFSDFDLIAKKHKLIINEIAGLTYPLSNILFGLSNYLIKKNESWKIQLSKEEQTILSSSGASKSVKYKTHFPAYFRYFINEVTMYPFYILQILSKRNKSSMIIYTELSARK